MADNNLFLVIIDPTATAQPALERAAWLAERLDAKLELFVCDYDQYLAGERFFDSEKLAKARTGLIDRHKKRLDKMASPLRERGLVVDIDAAWDTPLYEGILRKIDASNPRLVFKDTHYHSAIRRSVFSNTDWSLIRECSQPLWLVKPHEAPAIAILLAAVDPLHQHDKPAKLDHKILGFAESVRASVDGRLEVMHAFDPAVVYAVSGDSMAFPITEPVRDAVESLKSAHKAAFEALIDTYDIAAEQAHLVEGGIRDAVISTVEDLGADVVVIGAVSRSALERLVLGSTAEQVLDFVACDLLIVKPD